MRLIKMFGLAMLASVAAMAFVGVGSASAQLLGSVVCHLGEGAQGHCPAGSLPFTGAVLGFSLNLAGGTSQGYDRFLSGFVRVECLGHMEGEITNAGSLTEHPLGLITKVEWKGCKNNAFCGPTTATASNLPWHFTVLGSATLGLGTMHIKEVLGDFLLQNCFGVGHVLCTYDAETVLPHLEGHTGAMGSMITASNLELLLEAPSSGSCNATGKWDALYDLEPSDLTVHLL